MKEFRTTWWVALVIVAVWLSLFRNPLLSDEVCALRDAGNFYYPLFAWQCSEWGAGRVPLWNPYDGLGVPALADATSCTFYPGKLIFLLPVAFHLRFNLFIAGHVLFAAWSLFFVARRWRASEVAAGVGAMSYAYGGYVLFQHCNVVFLISASWLPLAVWLGEAMLSSRSPKRAVAFGGVLALMTLGGDPQTAYHAGLMIVLYALLLWWREMRAKLDCRSRCTMAFRGRRYRDGLGRPSYGIRTTSLQIRSTRTPYSSNLWRSRPCLLVLAAGSAFGLSAVQVLPTWEWTRRSDRSHSDAPASSIESPTSARVASATTPVDSHAGRIYYFSVGPWRLIELIWPNIAGHMFPIHRRWLSVLPGEGRVWTPTLYLGLVPVISAVAAWRWRRAALRDRWMLCLVVCGICGSLGWYGAGWVLHELRTAWPRGLASLPSPGQPVGGLYWFCVTVLPGYAYFRYPAKWFVFASLGLSLLAARGTDRILRRDPRAQRCLKCLFLLSLVLATVAGLGRPLFLRWLSGAPPNDVYGPLDSAGAWRDLFSAMLHVLAGTAVLGFLLQVTPRHKSVAKASLLILTALDLMIANQWLIASVPQSIFEAPSRAAELVRSAIPARTGQPPTRAIHERSFSSTPSAWNESKSERRVAEVVAWERHALLYKHHLPFQIGMLDSPTTIVPARWADRVNTLQSSASDQRGMPDRPDATIELDRFRVSWLSPTPEDGFIVARGVSGPRVWFEADDRGTAVRSRAQTTCLRYEPQCIEIAVEAGRSGTLIINDLADPGWTAEFRPESSARIQSASTIVVLGFLRGVRLSAGNFTVVLRYRPRSFYYGLAITLTTLVMCGGWVATSRSENFRSLQRLRKFVEVLG